MKSSEFKANANLRLNKIKSSESVYNNALAELLALTKNINDNPDITGATQQWVIDQGYLQSDDIAGLASEQWVQSQNYLTNITGLTADNSDQLGGVDAINYARTDVAETFNANVTIGVGAIISGNGSGLTNLDADTLNGKAASAYYNNIDNLVPWSEIFQAPDIPSAGDTSNWNAAYNDKINSIAFNTANGVVTFTQQDASVLAVDLDGRYRTDPQFITFDPITNNIGLIDSAETINLDSVYITIGTAIDATTLNGKAASAYYNNIDNLVPWSEIFQAPDIPSAGDTSNWNASYNDSITAVGFATGTGVLTLTQRDASVLTVDLDGRYRTSAQTLGFTAANGQLSIVDGNTISLDGRYMLLGGNISTLNNDSGYITSASLAPVATSNSYTDLINTPANLAYTNVNNNFTADQKINGQVVIEGMEKRLRFNSGGKFLYINARSSGAWAEFNTDLDYYRFMSKPVEIDHSLVVDGNASVTTLNGVNPSLFRTTAQELSFNSGNGELTIFDGNTVDLDSRYLPTSGTIDADTLSGRAIGTFYGTGVGQIALPVTLAYKNQDNSFTTSQTISGNVTATSFFGSGANLTGVAKTGVNNNFTADQTIYGALRVENDGNFVGLRLHNTITGRPGFVYFDASRQLNVWAAGSGTGTEGLIRFLIGSGSGTEVMRVNNDQKVFIGQTTGTEKLEVNGTAKMTSLLTSAPSGKTAYKWKFGNPSLNAVKLITDNSLWVEVNGTVYQLALVEPDLS